MCLKTDPGVALKKATSSEDLFIAPTVKINIAKGRGVVFSVKTRTDCQKAGIMLNISYRVRATRYITGEMEKIISEKNSMTTRCRKAFSPKKR